jgi:L-ascorbate metabolism protein UlaG (beta-lactamase superfamily)
VSAQHDHFPQHAQAVAEKPNFAALCMVPMHWNFANPQTAPMREIKQLYIEREAFDPRRFKNRSARLEAKRFKSALRVPKR